jgi:hypothetical protein
MARLRCLGCGGQEFYAEVEGVPTLGVGQQACGDLVVGRDIVVECCGCGKGFRVGSVTRPAEARSASSREKDGGSSTLTVFGIRGGGE